MSRKNVLFDEFYGVKNTPNNLLNFHEFFKCQFISASYRTVLAIFPQTNDSLTGLIVQTSLLKDNFVIFLIKF